MVAASWLEIVTALSRGHGQLNPISSLEQDAARFGVA
jgi:hypothetical protein